MDTMRTKHLALFGLTLLSLPLLGGCASQAKLKDYETELSALREERTVLKKENQSLRSQVDGYEIALAEASTKVGMDNASSARPLDYPALDSQGVGYEQRDGNMVLTLSSEITFASGKAELTAQGKQALAAVAKVLKADYAGGTYWIEGHTDTDPIKKSNFENNRELSVSRAMAVLTYLANDCSIPDDQCVVAGHSQYRPVAGNDTATNKARNRRVEIVVHMQ